MAADVLVLPLQKQRGGGGGGTREEKQVKRRVRITKSLTGVIFKIY